MFVGYTEDHLEGLHALIMCVNTRRILHSLHHSIQCTCRCTVSNIRTHKTFDSLMPNMSALHMLRGTLADIGPCHLTFALYAFQATLYT